MNTALQQQKRALVVGLGKTGLSCARFLHAQGVEVAVIDSREQPPGLTQLQEEYPDIALFTGGFDQSVINAADQIIISPGVSINEPVIQQAKALGIPIVGDIELFANYVNGMVIAITGSNGKSTVTSLLGAMAATAGRYARVGGNIGIPALDLLLEEHKDAADLYILELSSFQLETTHSLNAAAAVVLNISPDHLDRYMSMEDYIHAKSQVYHGDGVMVVNADDPLVMDMVEEYRTVLTFSLNKPPLGHHFGVRKKDDVLWLCQGENWLLSIDDMPMIGLHNVANALAALALGQVAGLPMDAMLETLQTFRGLAHRMQWVAEHQGVRWYNDSKATNVGATLASLQGLPGNIVLLAGGDSKSADFSSLKSVVAAKARQVILFGKDALLLEKALADTVPISVVPDLASAVKIANEQAEAGDNVLLAPACASFDQYQNYEQRGDHFIELVRQLI